MACEAKRGYTLAGCPGINKRHNHCHSEPCAELVSVLFQNPKPQVFT